LAAAVARFPGQLSICRHHKYFSFLALIPSRYLILSFDPHSQDSGSKPYHPDQLISIPVRELNRKVAGDFTSNSKTKAVAAGAFSDDESRKLSFVLHRTTAPIRPGSSHHQRFMAQAVSRRPPTAEARVRSRGQSMWGLWWTKWHWDRFFPRVLRLSPVSFIPLVLHYKEKDKK
jgi:hypothetical protein